MKQVNVSKEDNDKKRNKSRTGLKVSSLRNNRSNQNDPRLAWTMFHKIAHMYSYITKQETEQASLIIQGLHVNLDSTKAAGTSTATSNVSIPIQSTMLIYQTTVTTVPEDLKDIQPRPSQVWNCDKIGFDINGSWGKLVVLINYSLETGYG